MKRTIISILFVTIVISCFGCSERNSSNASVEPSTSLEGNASTKVLTNKVLHVTLRYPTDWIQIEYGVLGTQEFEGQDGYFSISCVTGAGKNVDEYAKEYNKVYTIYNGSNQIPKITSLTIDKQDARLIILPSDIVEQNDEAILYVEYPKKIIVNSFTHQGREVRFNIFELHADKNNIMQIAKTIKFIY